MDCEHASVQCFELFGFVFGSSIVVCCEVEILLGANLSSVDGPDL